MGETFLIDMLKIMQELITTSEKLLLVKETITKLVIY